MSAGGRRGGRPTPAMVAPALGPTAVERQTADGGDGPHHGAGAAGGDRVPYHRPAPRGAVHGSGAARFPLRTKAPRPRANRSGSRRSPRAPTARRPTSQGPFTRCARGARSHASKCCVNTLLRHVSVKALPTGVRACYFPQRIGSAPTLNGSPLRGSCRLRQPVGGDPSGTSGRGGAPGAGTTAPEGHRSQGRATRGLRGAHRQ